MYSDPKWNTAINFDKRLAAVPAEANARGMFFQFLLDALGPQVAKEIGAQRYIAFKSYPLRDYVHLLGLGSRVAFPGLPAAEAVRQLGRRVYPNYAKTLTGTALFSIAGHNFRRVVELCPRAYEIGMTPGKVTITSITDNEAFVELRGLWNLPEFHQVGVWEGGMDVCGVIGNIETHVIDFGSVDFHVTWRNG